MSLSSLLKKELCTSRTLADRRKTSRPYHTQPRSNRMWSKHRAHRLCFATRQTGRSRKPVHHNPRDLYARTSRDVRTSSAWSQQRLTSSAYGDNARLTLGALGEQFVPTSRGSFAQQSWGLTRRLHAPSPRTRGRLHCRLPGTLCRHLASKRLRVPCSNTGTEGGRAPRSS